MPGSKPINLNSPRQVIIRGHVFDYDEKAPFVASGESVLGALEYDFKSDRVKCHECGCWFNSIASHLANGKGVHGDLAVAEYKRRHGINLRSSGLIASGMREKLKASVALRASRNAPLVTPWRLTGNEFTGKSHAESSWKERKNVNARCQAQTIFRIQVLAAELGRTPTKREMSQAGLSSLFRDFGSHQAAIEQSGLIPNAEGYHGRRRSALPVGFPTREQLLDARMPWPNDYFTVRPEDALARFA